MSVSSRQAKTATKRTYPSTQATRKNVQSDREVTATTKSTCRLELPVVHLSAQANFSPKRLTILGNVHPRSTNGHHTDLKGKYGEEQHTDVRGQEPTACPQVVSYGRHGRRSFQHPRSVLHGLSPIGTILQIGLVRARVFFGPNGGGAGWQA